MRSPKRSGRAVDSWVGGIKRRPQLIDGPEQHALDQQAGANQKQHKQRQRALHE